MRRFYARALGSAGLMLCACGDTSGDAPGTDSGLASESSAASGVADSSDAGASTTAGDGVSSSGGATGLDLAAPSGECTEQELAALELEIADAFAAAALDPTVTTDPNATLLVASDDDRMLVHAHGDSAADRVYESASTSKWVTAAVILDLVDRGALELETTTSELLGFWSAPGVPLRNLLSFTSGFDDEAPCINLPGSDFAGCVEQMYEAGLADASAPGEVFHYSGSHMQFAGLMAVVATGAADWDELFADWQARTGLFPSGRYDLPSAANPRLAGGMHWTGAEYLDFLRALRAGDLLTDETRAAMLADQRDGATVEQSPALQGWGEDWSYGFGNWLECSTATDGPGSYDCGDGDRNSSAGAYGAYPLLDADHGFVAVVARQGGLASGAEGVRLFRAVAPLVERWAQRDCGAR